IFPNLRNAIAGLWRLHPVRAGVVRVEEFPLAQRPAAGAARMIRRRRLTQTPYDWALGVERWAFCLATSLLPAARLPLTISRSRGRCLRVRWPRPRAEYFVQQMSGP